MQKDWTLKKKNGNLNFWYFDTENKQARAVVTVDDGFPTHVEFMTKINGVWNVIKTSENNPKLWFEAQKLGKDDRKQFVFDYAENFMIEFLNKNQ